MSKAEYYSRQIMRNGLTDSEYLELEANILQWLDTASNEEIQEFEDYGAMECLYMICSGIRLGLGLE